MMPSEKIKNDTEISQIAMENNSDIYKTEVLHKTQYISNNSLLTNNNFTISQKSSFKRASNSNTDNFEDLFSPQKKQNTGTAAKKSEINDENITKSVKTISESKIYSTDVVKNLITNDKNLYKNSLISITTNSSFLEISENQAPPFFVTHKLKCSEKVAEKLRLAISHLPNKDNLKIFIENIISETIISIGYTGNELNSLLELDMYKSLKNFFFSKSNKNILLTPGANSKESIYPTSQLLINKYNKDTLDKLSETYKTLSLQYMSKKITINYPSFTNFQANDEEMKQIFTSLLLNNQGIIVGEIHHHRTPKMVLINQMKNLYDAGVRLFFLEHACHDTLQNEFDDFFKNKIPSPFLEKFLTTNFGNAVECKKRLYFMMVQAAVNQGIRPIALERSTTQKIGYNSIGGSTGKDRILAMNITAKEIIDMYEGQGKYIVFDGSAHNSFSSDIMGLSEICAIPSIVISDGNKNEYYTDVENLNLTKSDINNIDSTHFTHIYVKINPEQQMFSM